MQPTKHPSDMYNFLRHKCPPACLPTMSPRLSCAIDKKYLHERNTNMLFYLWLHNDQQFWFFPLKFTPVYVQGYYWDGEKWTGTYVKKEMIRAFF